MSKHAIAAPLQRDGAQRNPSILSIVSQHVLRGYRPNPHWSMERDYRLLMLRHHREALDTLAERLEEQGLSRVAAEALVIKYLSAKLPADSRL